MGWIVGLLLQTDDPVSLDEITEELQVSKGPVSQIMRRLREHNLVQKVWVPGSRRDYYRAEPDIFGQAFANHAELLGQNLVLARKYAALIAESGEPVPEAFARRTDEMVRFYTLMRKHLTAFLDEWDAAREEAGPRPAAGGRRMRLKDKIAIVTGGAAGLGRATVERFAAEGRGRLGLGPERGGRAGPGRAWHRGRRAAAPSSGP